MRQYIETPQKVAFLRFKYILNPNGDIFYCPRTWYAWYTEWFIPRKWN